MRNTLFGICLVALLVPPLANARSKHPDNRLVAFENSGDWEVWCVELGDTHEVVCDLNLVLVYKPRPDFRAMILRVYLDARERHWVEVEYERQTSFSGGFLASAAGPRFELDECERPCTLYGERAGAFIAALSAAGPVTIHFRDYLVQSFEVDLGLDGFAAGLTLLRQMQLRYRN